MTSRLDVLLARVAAGHRPNHEEAAVFLDAETADVLMEVAEPLTIAGHGTLVTYSRKVFIPLTQLCRNVCHYCTFAKAPRRLKSAYLSVDEVLEIALQGQKAGCTEALFTLGDRPEDRYTVAREALDRAGVATTLELVEKMARRVFEDTTLLPHVNPGLMSHDDLRRLRPVSASMGLMLENSAERLCHRGGSGFGSPDKWPKRRLAALRAAGELAVPMTTGLLIGIGETRRERIDSLLDLRDLHDEFGHLQELIIQNFRAKPDTKMAAAAEPTLDEQLWTVAVARLLFGRHMSIQAPPNLRPEGLTPLVRAGVNDWGGVSPVTPDHVNPEAPWPALADLEASTSAAGRTLRARLPLVPAFAVEAKRWCDPAVVSRIHRVMDSRGLLRTDQWQAGTGRSPPSGIPAAPRGRQPSSELAEVVARASDGIELRESDIVTLFSADGDDLECVISGADALRRDVVGDAVSFVVNRNINYTNICVHRCGFCAFSKGRSHRDLRGPAYNLDFDEIGARAAEAAALGATEVCLQGGIHPSYTGETYLAIVAAVKAAAPAIHVHAFSPLEIRHGASTLDLSIAEYLERLRRAGLSTLPGTAAEILDDEVRSLICADKLTTDEWLQIVRTAHEVGLTTTATIMFGHVEGPIHWARHLMRLRALQAETGGITEFVPLPFVHMESPLWRRGLARSGPTFREALLMHAVSRLVLHPLIPNIQTSWVKMGPVGAARCLAAGANDLGGTLMNESITRAAGGVHGQEMTADSLRELAASVGRPSRIRNSVYGRSPDPAARLLAVVDAALV